LTVFGPLLSGQPPLISSFCIEGYFITGRVKIVERKTGNAEREAENVKLETSKQEEV
jgi:hypothetical protein